MIKNKKYFFWMPWILLLILTSCGPGNNPYLENYYTGIKGVEMEFIGNSPPDEIYEGTEFPLAVFISNEGAFSLNGSLYKGTLSYSFDPYYLSVKSDSISKADLVVEELFGKSYTHPKGGIGVYVLPSFMAEKIAGQRESPDTDLFISVCYPYRTTLADEVCIDTSDFVDVREKVCEVENKVYTSQGAPLVVTSVDVGNRKDGSLMRPSFLIKIENKGSGMVLAPVEEKDLSEACELQKESYYKSRWNSVKISAELSSEKLTCIPDEIHLRDERGFATCFLDGGVYGGNLNYYSSLVVKLDYVYMTSISKKIELIRSGIPTYDYSTDSGNCQYWQTDVGGGNCIDNCALCAQGANFPFCDIVDSDWDCSCGANECLSVIGSKKIEEWLGKQTEVEIEFANGNCIFGAVSLCQPGKFCCVKQ
ncbi:MAG: hypothetical protein ABIB43_04460 [archaeon]